MSFIKNSRVLVTGSTGFFGKNLIPELEKANCELITPTRSEYDLTRQDAVERLLNKTKPDLVIHLASLVGGVMANKNSPADFYYRNILPQTFMMHESYKNNVKKFVTLMGGCSYPSDAISPISEDQMWDGYPQMESAPYSTAKKMNIVMSKAYREQYGFNSIVLVPGNIYGPWDNFDLTNSHVIPALIRKYDSAKNDSSPAVTAWGSGKPTRDFIYISDAVECVLKAVEIYNESEIINISTGTRTSIKELTTTISDVVGYKGSIEWDSSKPDGQLEKIFDVTRMSRVLDFEPKVSLRDGLSKTYRWYKENTESIRFNEPVCY